MTTPPGQIVLPSTDLIDTGALQQRAPVVLPGTQEALQGHSLLTAAFAAFVLVLFGHMIRRVFPIDESHEGSFPLVSMRSPGKRLPRSLDARIRFQLSTHYKNDTTTARPITSHLHPQMTRYTRRDQGPGPGFGMRAWLPRSRVSLAQGANHTPLCPPPGDQALLYPVQQPGQSAIARVSTPHPSYCRCRPARDLAHPERWVLPLSVVDNSNFSPNRLTALSTLLILASQGAFSSPHFKQRGLVWSFMCSWSCLWSVSSSIWRCFGVLTGFLFGLPPHEEEPSAPRSNVS